MTFTEFLLARIAEDEEIAHAAIAGHTFEETGKPKPEWLLDSYRYHRGWTDEQRESYYNPDNGWMVRVPYSFKHWSRWTKGADGELVGEVRDHLNAWWPGRVLSECEAKRRIIEAYNRENLLYDQGKETWLVEGLELAAHSLALPYADHPDWQKEWAA